MPLPLAKTYALHASFADVAQSETDNGSFVLYIKNQSEYQYLFSLTFLIASKVPIINTIPIGRQMNGFLINPAIA